MNKNIRVAVIGGSLVGPLAEALLRAEGFTNVTTYEAAPEVRPQSGGVIGVRETGFPALAHAGIPLSAIRAYPGKAVTTYNIADRQVVGLRDSNSYPGETTAWDIFHNAVTVRAEPWYGKKVTNLDGDGNLWFADGSMTTADWVIFADGCNSTGRKILDPDRKLSYQGYLVWRGLAEPVEGTEGFERYRNDENGRLFSLTEPITQGAHAGQTDWTYYHNLPESEFTALVGQSPTKRVFLLPHHFSQTLREFMLNQASAHLPAFAVDTMASTGQLMAVPINDLSFPSRLSWRWGKVRATLIGDAAMTVRPHSGRGINNGIDQLWELVKCLRGTDTLDDALRIHQSRVLPMLSEWVELGLVRAKRNGLGVPAHV